VVREKGGKVTIHTFRHTFASRLVQAGVSLAKVSKLLGHSSVTTTEIYAHLAPNEVSEEAVEVLNRLTR
ncbi:MAG: site-specific integrase, partial [Nitrososphaera sp.]|nr:site-specific integrase [Nitrososphaera sp.]